MEETTSFGVTHPTSPTLPTDPGIVTTRKQFSDVLTMDLTDDEITQALAIILPIKKKWETRFRYKFSGSTFTVEQAMKLIDECEKELVHTLAEKLDIMASIDASPVFEGEPMVIELQGALSGHSSAKYGMDHEKKSWEVKKALITGESFLGESKI